jgi:hypothetical protein
MNNNVWNYIKLAIDNARIRKGAELFAYCTCLLPICNAGNIRFSNCVMVDDYRSGFKKSYRTFLILGKACRWF